MYHFLAKRSDLISCTEFNVPYHQFEVIYEMTSNDIYQENIVLGEEQII